jgi:YidC/Oxa1 family membrane protein insertase
VSFLFLASTVFGLLEPIEAPLQSLLEWIHESLGVTWAWSIVILTCIVRIAMIPLTVKQQQSMRAMQALQPEIKKLQAKHKGDRQKLNQEMMAFYKENKVNPFGSCIPLLVQAPIFISLYFVLKDLPNDVQPGDDLSFLGSSVVPNITTSLQDLPTATLIIMMTIYVGSQMASTLLMPTSLDKTQRYIFLALPLIFAVVIVNQSFPAGLLIYWITTNLWTVGQALVIRTFFPPPLLASQKAAAKKGKEPPPPPKDKPVKPKPKPDGPDADSNGAAPDDEEAPTAGTGASASKKRKGDRVQKRNVRRPAKPDRPRGQPGSQPGGQPGGSGADS